MPSNHSNPRDKDLLRPYSIGPKLRTLRASKRLTLSRLSVEIGMSTALLSKLETDRMVPTLATLARICRVYGVNLSYFFSDIEHHSLAITRQAHLSNGYREIAGVKRTLLHLPSPTGKQVSQLVEIPAGATLNMTERGGRIELTAYVLEGMLRLASGTTDEVIRTGDCIVLDTEDTLLLSASESDCRVLFVRAK